MGTVTVYKDSGIPSDAGDPLVAGCYDVRAAFNLDSVYPNEIYELPSQIAISELKPGVIGLLTDANELLESDGFFVYPTIFTKAGPDPIRVNIKNCQSETSNLKKGSLIAKLVFLNINLDVKSEAGGEIVLSLDDEGGMDHSGVNTLPRTVCWNISDTTVDNDEESN